MKRPTRHPYVASRDKNASPVSFLPNALWSKMLVNASFGAERLARILTSPNFTKLPLKSQLEVIKLAADQVAHIGGLGESSMVTINNNDYTEPNALRNMQTKALDLPEFTKSPDRKSSN